MFNIKSILFSAFVLFCMTFSAYADNSYGLKSNIQDGVILHCFDWKLSDIILRRHHECVCMAR